ncbi:MAG: zinc-binding dehydrogenase [Dehalococcoidia bacterium]|jgi:threonine dehydrogenase-like Zn-dependent dehydrogenase|nr:zinc-binding dehydrogenase [Dehalococcoidia bacterium]
MKGLAAVFTGGRRPVDIVDLEVPDLVAGGSRIRNTGAAVCGSDLHGWRGDGDGPPSSRRMVGGHECSGVVDALGAGVSTDSLGRTLKEGDRVVYPFFFPCLRCYQCVHGELHACPNRYHPRFKAKTFEDYPYCNGGFAQYWSLPQGHFVFKAPDGIPDTVLATVNCSLAQVTWAIHQGALKFGDTVVVQGAGGLGIYATAVAADAGASRVIVIDGQPARLDLARLCGATDTIDLREFGTPESRVSRVHELTSGVGADVVVEVVGVAAATLEGLDMVRGGGKYIDVGNISGGSITLPGNRIIRGQIHWIGVGHYNPWILENAVSWLARVSDKYPLFDLVSHTFPLDQIEQAFDTAEWSGKAEGSIATRVVVDPWG